MGNSSIGSKWIIGLMIYFLFLTTVMLLITYTVGGDIETDIDTYKPNQCNSPRFIYEPYNPEPVYHTLMSEEELSDRGLNVVQLKARNKEAHLNCMESYGVLGEDVCLSINGCDWNTTGLTWYQRIFSWFPGYNPEDPEPTCLGTIDADSYDIEYRTVFLSGGENVVISHDNDAFPYNMGSICSHPEVINDESLCETFSCSWLTTELISELDLDAVELRGGIGIISNTWNVIKEMFTFRFDWGFDNELGNYIANFLTIFLPLLILIFALINIIWGK